MHPIFLNYIHILIVAVHFLLTPIRRKYILSAVHDSCIRKPLFHRTHRQNEGRSSHHASLCSSQSLFRKRLTIHRSVLLHRRLPMVLQKLYFPFYGMPDTKPDGSGQSYPHQGWQISSVFLVLHRGLWISKNHTDLPLHVPVQNAVSDKDAISIVRHR